MGGHRPRIPLSCELRQGTRNPGCVHCCVSHSQHLAGHRAGALRNTTSVENAQHSVKCRRKQISILSKYSTINLLSTITLLCPWMKSCRSYSLSSHSALDFQFSPRSLIPVKVPGLPLGGLDIGLPLYWSHRPFHPPSLLTVSPLALLGGRDGRDKGSSSGLGVLTGGGSNVDCLGREVILWVHQSAPPSADPLQHPTSTLP